MVFVIHRHESAMDLYVFPIPIPPPASLPIPSLWVFPVHQPWALVWSLSCPRDSEESSPANSLKASILQCSAFFMVQLWNPYMTTGKIIALTRWTFVSKVMSLLFNILSRFVRAFLPRNQCLNFIVAVTIPSDFGAQENKVSLSPFFPYLFVRKWWDWMP